MCHGQGGGGTAELHLLRDTSANQICGPDDGMLDLLLELLDLDFSVHVATCETCVFCLVCFCSVLSCAMIKV